MDAFEVARFSTLNESEVAVAFLRSRGIDAHLPDRNALTVYPFWQVAFGNLRVLAPRSQLAAARTLIAEARSGAFAGETEDWSVEALPGKVGELEEAEVHGSIGGFAKAARWMIVFWLVFTAAVVIAGLLSG